jgi:hypothetical protein
MFAWYGCECGRVVNVDNDNDLGWMKCGGRKTAEED